MSDGRLPAAPLLAAAAVLFAASAGLQAQRDRVYRTDRPAEQILYVQSPEVARRLALSYHGLVADVYWIRALQYFGFERKSPNPVKNYELLYPLIDMATGLDPQFNIAYRFGAVFLSERKPGGAGRPDLAEKLLLKGLKHNPHKWQYAQDIGFVHFWGNGDYQTAAKWFEKAADMPGSAWFLRPLAATTLSQGGQRSAARALFQALVTDGEIEWAREDAKHRLRQLDAMDQIDRLQQVVDRYRAQAGPAALTWDALIRAGVLRGVPRDSDNVPFALNPSTGKVDVSPQSSLSPLPVAPPAHLNRLPLR
jgi:tetratricopeptide (TPR) repeat protein